MQRKLVGIPVSYINCHAVDIPRYLLDLPINNSYDNNHVIGGYTAVHRNSVMSSSVAVGPFILLK